MINELPLTMLKCLVLTVLIETVAARIIGIKSKTDLVIVAMASVLTNPPVVLITFFSGLFHGITGYYTAAVICEISAVLIEGFVYFKALDWKKINPFLLSLLLNGISYGIGLIIGKYI